MRLVDGVGVVVAELVYDLCYPVVVLRLEGIANETLELECAAFALVVELIVKRFRNVGVHSDSVRQLPLHGAATDSLWSTRGGRRVVNGRWQVRLLSRRRACFKSSHAGTDVDVHPCRQHGSRPTTTAGQQRSHTQLLRGRDFCIARTTLSLICAMTPKSYRIYTQPSLS